MASNYPYISGLQNSHYVYGGEHNMSAISRNPGNFPELKELSIAQLQVLNSDEGKLIEFMHYLSPIKKLHVEKDRLEELNDYLAKDNLNKKPTIDQRKKEVYDKLQDLSQHRQQFDQLTQKHQELSECFAPSAIAEQLLISAVDMESKSEEIATQFLEGNLPVDAFLRKFMEKRIVYHSRRAKEERLQHQLRELQKAGF